MFTHSKGTVFFFPRKSLKFAPFCGFSSKWVKMLFFFFRPCFFFSGPWERVSEWVVNFSWEKKNTFLLEKKTPQKCKNTCFPRGAVFHPSEWLSNFSWEKKNTSVFFFFQKSGKKKQNSLKTSEWVGVKLFRGKKNTVPLVVPIKKKYIQSKIQIIHCLAKGLTFTLKGRDFL